MTLTAGVGGSLLSIGSAAGVGLMGQARGICTFFGHLKWTPAIALGYFASIWAALRYARNASLLDPVPVDKRFTGRDGRKTPRKSSESGWGFRHWFSLATALRY